MTLASYTLPERLARRTLVDPNTGCWEWQGCRTPEGYGQIAVDGRICGTHRIAWESYCGPIPNGLQVDHLCRNPRCCNPEHLEPVTLRENILRGESPAARNARKTHCKNGHEFTPENTYQRKDGRGGRECRTCREVAWRKYEAKRR